MSKHMPYRYFAALTAAALLVPSGTGCRAINFGSEPNTSPPEKTVLSKLKLPSGVPWKADKKPPPQAPARMVVTWQDAVMQREGHPSQRGFGGRLFFYNSKDPKPVTVSGRLVVYAFEDEQSERPSRKFVFPAAQFARHESESDLGVSYSVWLPWGEAGGGGQELSLVARFEPLEGGSMVVSEMANAYLPGGGGPRFATRVQQRRLNAEVRQASHEAARGATSAELASTSLPTAAPAPHPAGRLRMETTTIALPRR